MDGSGYAAIAAAILVGGTFGFFLPGYMIVQGAIDGNWFVVTVGVIWIAIATYIVIAICKWVWKPKKEE